jgi:hypothetical protein
MANDVQIQPFEYPIDGLEHTAPEAPLGTNIMDLFSNFLPTLDPIFYQGVTGSLDFDPTFK